MNFQWKVKPHDDLHYYEWFSTQTVSTCSINSNSNTKTIENEITPWLINKASRNTLLYWQKLYAIYYTYYWQWFLLFAQGTVVSLKTRHIQQMDSVCSIYINLSIHKNKQVKSEQQDEVKTREGLREGNWQGLEEGQGGGSDIMYLD